MPTVYPRIHVLLARSAPVGLVLRRGPSKRVCAIAWNRRDDSFTVGQWFKGRVYERRSDISPDGKHLIYFALDGKWESETKGAYTAVSRVPFFKPIGLWPNGSAWLGGGLFVDDRAYWINDGCGCHEVRVNPPGLRRAESYPREPRYGGECPGVYYLRLQRDGWILADRQNAYLFDKAAPGGATLRKIAYATNNHPHGKGCYYDEHELELGSTPNMPSWDWVEAGAEGIVWGEEGQSRAAETGTSGVKYELPNQGKTLHFPSWEWADVDRHRIVWAEKGCLFAAELSDSGLGESKLLYDFNGIQP